MRERRINVRVLKRKHLARERRLRDYAARLGDTLARNPMFGASIAFAVGLDQDRLRAIARENRTTWDNSIKGRR